MASTSKRNQLKKKGIFLVIEGAHGSGKTMLARRLKKKLEKKRLKIWSSKEPFSSELTSIISKISREKYPDPIALQYLILADRAIHVRQISKKLKESELVISVRYILSNLVYQRIQKIPEKKIIMLNSEFPQPDLTLILLRNLQKRFIQMRKNSKVRRQSYFLKNSSVQLEQKYYNKIAANLKNKKTFKILNADKPKDQLVNEAYEFIIKNIH